MPDVGWAVMPDPAGTPAASDCGPATRPSDQTRFTGSSKADATMAGPLPLPERRDRCHLRRADVRRLWAFSSRPTRACWRGLRRRGHPGEVAGVIIAGELARPPAAPNLRA